MSNLLNSTDFGKKLYNSLPPVYRLDDESVDFALKRFFSALTDGGIAEVINDINGLLTLIDPDKVDSEVLPILFKHYGFDYFNGIPELYLRKLVPLISDLQAKKGSVVATEYITSILSGVRPFITIDKETKTLNVRLEMDSSEGGADMPDQEQLLRIMSEFVPFFYDILVVYTYVFDELGNIKVTENPQVMNIVQDLQEIGVVTVEDIFHSNTKFLDNESTVLSFSLCSDSLTNKCYNQLNGKFFYTNSASSYDAIRYVGSNKIEYKFILNE